MSLAVLEQSARIARRVYMLDEAGILRAQHGRALWRVEQQERLAQQCKHLGIPTLG